MGGKTPLTKRKEATHKSDRKASSFFIALAFWHLDKKLLKKLDEDEPALLTLNGLFLPHNAIIDLLAAFTSNAIERKTEERQRTLLHRGVEIRKNIDQRRKVSSHDEDYDQRRESALSCVCRASSKFGKTSPTKQKKTEKKNFGPFVTLKAARK